MSERVLMCGSRGWVESLSIYWKIYALNPGDVVIHGGAPGADTIAGAAALRSGLAVEVFRADWAKHGKSAGPIRNALMISDGKPDRVVAFRMPGESRGTDDLIRRAEAAGIPVEVVGPEGDVRLTLPGFGGDDDADDCCLCGHDTGDHHFGCEALPDEGCPCTAIYPDDRAAAATPARAQEDGA